MPLISTEQLHEEMGSIFTKVGSDLSVVVDSKSSCSQDRRDVVSKA